jgi:putative DNA primase/helicase
MEDIVAEREVFVNSDLRVFKHTDTGNAERFAAQHADDVRFVHGWKKWLYWDGRRWKQDAVAEVERLGKTTVRSMYGEARAIEDEERRKALVKHATASESVGRRTSMLRLAQSEVSVAAEPDGFDQLPMLLNCENGTLDLETGVLRDHRRDDFLTKLAPVRYDDQALAPK